MEIQKKQLKFNFGVKYNHKKYKAYIKKLKRQKRRQETAIKLKQHTQEDEIKLFESPGYAAWKECQARATTAKDEEDKKISERLNQEWLEREKKAREEFIKKAKHQILQDKLKHNPVALNNVKVSIISKHQEDDLKDRPTHNPNAPPNYICNDSNLLDCSYYTKTGVCKYGLRCKKRHPNPGVTDTLLFPNMYCDMQSTFNMFDAHETDMNLETDEYEIYKKYKAFRADVLPEFQNLGQVIQFVVCRNYEPHLMGNVYVQYVNEQCAQLAFQRFNGRYYAGKQLQCQFVQILVWKSAICGLFDRGRCPKGRTCNYLHIFKNSPSSLSKHRKTSKPFRASYSERRHERDRSRHKEKSKHTRDIEEKLKNTKSLKRNCEESVGIPTNHRLGDFWAHKELKLYYVKKDENNSACEGKKVGKIGADKMTSLSDSRDKMYELSKKSLIRNLGSHNSHSSQKKKDEKSYKHKKHKHS